MEKEVYKAINAVQATLAKIGISKTRKNKEQGYAFRGIDDIYGTLAPILAENHLCILPRITERDFRERTTARGTVLFYVTIKGEFDFVSSIDGSMHTVSTYGEAMDTADKATNKAMSAAYKYACLQAFCIPTEGDNDADATTHTVAPQTQSINDEVPFANDPDTWMTYNAFAGEMERCTDITQISEILNGQKGNPRIKELIPLATARKQEILQTIGA